MNNEMFIKFEGEVIRSKSYYGGGMNQKRQMLWLRVDKSVFFGMRGAWGLSRHD